MTQQLGAALPPGSPLHGNLEQLMGQLAACQQEQQQLQSQSAALLHMVTGQKP
jgi:hypothetical protein